MTREQIAGLKDTVPERPYHSYLIRIRIQWKFRQNSGNLIRIHQKFWNLKTNQHFLWYLAKFRENFIKIGEKINENYLKIAIFLKIHEKMRRSFTKFCWDFHIQLVQRNANLVGTFGFLFFSLRGLRWTRNGWFPLSKSTLSTFPLSSAAGTQSKKFRV